MLNINLTAGNTFYNYASNSTYSKPLIGSGAIGAINYGAFVFEHVFTGTIISGGAFINAISITDSTNNYTQYVSGTDFSSSPSSFTVHDQVVACYGLTIYSANMHTLFSASAAAITSPSLAPSEATSGYSSSNPQVSANCTVIANSQIVIFETGVGAGGTNRGVVISKSGSDYWMAFGSGNTSALASANMNVNTLQITLNGTNTATYTPNSDFNIGYVNNSAQGEFRMLMTVSNTALQTLLTNSFLS